MSEQDRRNAEHDRLAVDLLNAVQEAGQDHGPISLLAVAVTLQQSIGTPGAGPIEEGSFALARVAIHWHQKAKALEVELKLARGEAPVSLEGVVG